MDPTQTLREMITAAKTKDVAEYRQLSEELLVWLMNGGFEPAQTADYDADYVKYPEDDYERGE
jgi:hypothetical protein